MSSPPEDILKGKSGLGPAHEHRSAAVDLRLPFFANGVGEPYGKLALSSFALHKPEMYFDRATAAAVLETLTVYANEDLPRLNGILKECRPELDATFELLAAINGEEDDGGWPSDEVDQLRRIDTLFLFRHLRLLEYVLDPLALPIVAFHCDRQGVNWRDRRFGTKSRLEDHLPKTPARTLAKHWSATVRNGIAHGGVRHLGGELEFRDDKGRSESRSYYEFVRDTDRLLDACNGAALAYMAFFLRLTSGGGRQGVPLGIARAALHGFVDRPACSVEHVAVFTRSSGPQLHVYLRHRFRGVVNLLHEAYRTALVGLDLMPEIDLFGVHFRSATIGPAFFYFERKDLAPYASGEIDLEELLRRVSAHPMQYWDTSLPMRPASSRGHQLIETLRAGWPGLVHELREQARARGKLPVDIIEVRDMSVDRMTRRMAAVSVDALPGQTSSFSLETFRLIARAVNRAKVRIPGKWHRGARALRKAKYLRVQVYSHEVRPRTSAGNPFAPPYFFTLEYSRDGKFLLPALLEHQVITKGRYRCWIPNRIAGQEPEGLSTRPPVR